MRNSLRRKLLKFSGALAAGLLVAWYYASSRDVWELEPVLKYHVLCDACTLPGAFMMLLGVLIVLSNAGALDTLAFFFHYLTHTFIPLLGPGQSYLDFVEERRAKPGAGFAFLLLAGGVLLLAAAVFLILYFKASA